MNERNEFNKCNLLFSLCLSYIRVVSSFSCKDTSSGGQYGWVGDLGSGSEVLEDERNKVRKNEITKMIMN